MTNLESKVPRNRNRLIFLLVVALFVIPFIAAYWFYGKTEETKVWRTTNRGLLIRPAQPLQEFSLISHSGEKYNLEKMLGSWALVFVPSNPCNEACKKNIYHMRQIWVSLGRNANRVRRFVLLRSDNEKQNLERFLVNYPQTIVLVDSDRQFIRQLESATQTDEPVIMLLDPVGNLMMAFPQSMDPRDILRDLKKLLKSSQTG